MWRRGTTSTCSGAAGLMSLKATVVVGLVHDLGGHVARHDPAEEAVAQSALGLSHAVMPRRPLSRSSPEPDHPPELTGRQLAVDEARTIPGAP